MRINCGPTRAERQVRREHRLTHWHNWFAWRPIRIGPRHCVWLETIQRKGRENTSYGGPSYDWDYRVDGQEFEA